METAALYMIAARRGARALALLTVSDELAGEHGAQLTAEERERTFDDMVELDRYAMVTLADLVEKVTRAYDEWRFHMVYRHIYDYCVTDLSSFYLDVLKDRLYADAASGLPRRSAQTVLAAMLSAMVRLVAPVLTFTSEEIWQFMPESMRDGAESVQLAGWPAFDVPADEAARLRADYGVVATGSLGLKPASSITLMKRSRFSLSRATIRSRSAVILTAP